MNPDYADFKVESPFKSSEIKMIKSKYECNWVPIIDVGIKKYDKNRGVKYEAYDKAVEYDCLIKSNVTG